MKQSSMVKRVKGVNEIRSIKVILVLRKSLMGCAASVRSLRETSA
jgi:hypothetical protein